jgi:hypothetical protein
MVHSYKRWDTARDRYVTTRLKGTPNYITSIQGEIMRHTEEEVSPRDIDKQGRYDPATRDRRTQFDAQLFHRVGGMEDGGFGMTGAMLPESGG